ncbi:hypothetical protein D9613_012171 [Agrocybe pediades]|uniref:Uncharacterized protein n=1 Tax=Agrocybe pediades TaxID=84607 RepID=A0A8H4VVR9_9AGAR|nr:hypothetical protein D9613_012171 [Agrocybe pediades]
MERRYAVHPYMRLRPRIESTSSAGKVKRGLVIDKDTTHVWSEAAIRFHPRQLSWRFHMDEGIDRRKGMEELGHSTPVTILS